MSLNPHVRICTHIKVTGIRCGSPALREERFCYFHQRMIRGVPTPRRARIHPMALIESPESIQVALMETINAIVRNQIDLHRAALIIKALHIAVKNSPHVRFHGDRSEMIRKLPEFEEVAEQAALSAPVTQPAAALPFYASQEWELQTLAEEPIPVLRNPPGRVSSAIAKPHAEHVRTLRE